MHTRSGLSCGFPPPTKRLRSASDKQAVSTSSCPSPASAAWRDHGNLFEVLPDDLLVCIFSFISSSAASSAELIAPRLTCKRFNSMGGDSQVLRKASLNALGVKASSLSHGAFRFLRSCADFGNIEACYTLGLILFYCLRSRGQGITFLTRAAKANHAAALHSLAVIKFNGSGGTKKHKNFRAGVSLCMRAAALGHVDSMRELGHCLQDGYGVQKNVLEGRRLLLEANAREAAAAVTFNLNISEPTLQITATKIAIGCFQHHLLSQSSLSKLSNGPKSVTLQSSVNYIHAHPMYRYLQSGGCSLLSDFGCNVPPPKPHIAHRFLVNWHEMTPPTGGLRLCSRRGCGRPETRRHEFRRCSACSNVNYCCRACQAMDWKLKHKFLCVAAGNRRANHLIEAQDVVAMGERGADNGHNLVQAHQTNNFNYDIN